MMIDPWVLKHEGHRCKGNGIDTKTPYTGVIALVDVEGVALNGVEGVAPKELSGFDTGIRVVRCATARCLDCNEPYSSPRSMITRSDPSAGERNAGREQAMNTEWLTKHHDHRVHGDGIETGNKYVGHLAGHGSCEGGTGALICRDVDKIVGRRGPIVSLSSLACDECNEPYADAPFPPENLVAAPPSPTVSVPRSLITQAVLAMQISDRHIPSSEEWRRLHEVQRHLMDIVRGEPNASTKKGPTE